MVHIDRVLITQEASALIDRLRDMHGELMFHMSGGCCDGSSPMCFEKGDFKTGDSDVMLGVVNGCEFWLARDQYEYLKHTQLTLDVTAGRGSSFSLEIPLGFRFLIRSRVFTDEEFALMSELSIN